MVSFDVHLIILILAVILPSFFNCQPMANLAVIVPFDCDSNSKKGSSADNTEDDCDMYQILASYQYPFTPESPSAVTGQEDIKNATNIQGLNTGNLEDLIAEFYYDNTGNELATMFLFPDCRVNPRKSNVLSELDLFSLYIGHEVIDTAMPGRNSVNYAINHVASLGGFWSELYRRYRWRSSVIIVDLLDRSDVWTELTQTFMEVLVKPPSWVKIHVLSCDVNSLESLRFTLQTASRLSRIIHLFGEYDLFGALEGLTFSSNQNSTEKQAVFFTYDSLTDLDPSCNFCSSSTPNATLSLSNSASLAVIAVAVPSESSDCAASSESLRHSATQEGVDLLQQMLNESSFLYGDHDQDLYSGTVLSARCRNKTYTVNGWDVSFDQNGNRLGDIVISLFNSETKKFDLYVAILLQAFIKYSYSTAALIPLNDDLPDWWPVVTSEPFCEPSCFENTPLNPGQIIGMIIGVFLPIIGLIFFQHYFRQYLAEVELMSNWWQVPAKSVLFPDHTSSVLMNRDDSVLNAGVSVIARSRTQLLFSGNVPRYVTLGKGNAWRSLIFGEAVGPTRVSRALRLFLLDLRNIKHPNVNSFVGLSLDGKPPSILEAFCARGSVADWIENGTHYNWDLRFSLLLDLLQGLQYIHASPVKFHGNLKSTKCLLDKSFGLKISDVGNERIICLLRHGNLTEIQSIVNRFDRRLTVPKIFEEDTMSPGGDVFSFGLVACEIVTEVDSAQLLNENLMNGRESKKSFHNPLSVSFNPIRFGSVCVDGHDFLDLRLLSLIQRCCDENPYNRPSVDRSIEVISNLMEVSMGATYMERLIRRLASYAQSLESSVAEKTTMVIRERDKCERLLQELVPKEIVRHFFCGESVTPESYDMATVLVTEFYGFAEFIATSRPANLFMFLHQLYSVFDEILHEFDVYKIDTTGDQYIVVSGAPVRIDDLHAGEICQLAIDLQLSFAQMRERRKMQLSIGVHTESMAAGVVGVRRPRYSIFGTIVEVAKRLAHEGATGSGILVSGQTEQLAKPLGFHFVRNKGAGVRIRERGEPNTYWLAY